MIILIVIAACLLLFAFATFGQRADKACPQCFRKALPGKTLCLGCGEFLPKRNRVKPNTARPNTAKNGRVSA